MSPVVWLEDVRRKDIPLVGGKGASLGEMIGAGLPVPGGFAVTADAFRRFITETGIADQIFKALEIDVDNDEQLVKLGITSISSNIDAVERVREMVARTEQKILLDAARSSFSK